MKKRVVFISTLIAVVGFLLFYKEKSPSPILFPREWMREQVEKEVAPLRNQKISLREMREYFSKKLIPHSIVEVQIKKNKIRKFMVPEIKNNWISYRFSLVHNALRDLARSHPLPDVTFFIHLWDSYEEDSPFPLFVFAKNKKFSGQLMLPDHCALGREYQILSGIDLEKREIPWEGRFPKLVWRGSASQGIVLNSENFRTISRVTLCELSKAFPNLIDAGFTIYSQGADTVPQMEEYRKERLSYQELVKSKYQCWVDGNSASYSDSGWRFFSNSVVVKPESENIQWYYQALEPGKHYISVKANLEDLVEKVEYLQSHDAYAQEIAKNGREFALTHLTHPESLRYLYHLIWEYSRLPFEN